MALVCSDCTCPKSVMTTLNTPITCRYLREQVVARFCHVSIPHSSWGLCSRLSVTNHTLINLLKLETNRSVWCERIFIVSSTQYSWCFSVFMSVSGLLPHLPVCHRLCRSLADTRSEVLQRDCIEIPSVLCENWRRNVPGMSYCKPISSDRYPCICLPFADFSAIQHSLLFSCDNGIHSFWYLQGENGMRWRYVFLVHAFPAPPPLQSRLYLMDALIFNFLIYIKRDVLAIEFLNLHRKRDISEHSRKIVRHHVLVGLRWLCFIVGSVFDR